MSWLELTIIGPPASAKENPTANKDRVLKIKTCETDAIVVYQIDEEKEPLLGKSTD